MKDLDKTIDYLTSLGLGPFTIRRNEHPSAMVRGKKVSYQVRIGLAQQGPVYLELIEYQKGTTIHEEFLREKDGGLHYILFKVPDINVALARFAKKGIGVLQQDKFVEGGGLAYMDTETIGGMIIELAQFPSDYDPNMRVKFAAWISSFS